MPQSLGNTPVKSNILKGVESHKLHQEFLVATAQNGGTTIKKGQLVKLHSTGDVLPLQQGDSHSLAIGIAVMEAEVETFVTVATRGYVVVRAESGNALTPGPVEYTTYNGTTEANVVDTASSSDVTIGWALDEAAGAGEEVRVLIRD